MIDREGVVRALYRPDEQEQETQCVQETVRNDRDPQVAPGAEINRSKQEPECTVGK